MARMGKLAREALNFNRQLLDSEAATDYLTGRGIDLGIAVAHGLGWDEENARVTFPYLDRFGDVIGWKGRYIGPVDPDRQVPKYFAAPGGEIAALWPVPADEVDGPVVLCEGEFDALALMSRGVRAVSVPGASAWDKVRDEVLDIVDRSGRRQIVLAVDSDPAGDRLLAEVIGTCDRLALPYTVATPGAGRDVTDELLDPESTWFHDLCDELALSSEPPF